MCKLWRVPPSRLPWLLLRCSRKKSLVLCRALEALRLNKKVPVWRLWSEEVCWNARAPGCRLLPQHPRIRLPSLKPANCTFQDIVRGDAGVLADLLNDIRTAYVPNFSRPCLLIFTF